MKSTRIANKGKFTYNGQGIASDGKDYWSFDNDTARNVVIFSGDDSSSSGPDNPKNDFLVLGEKLTEDINGSVGTAEKNWY